MSTSDHPETDGQTERANRVLEEILRGYVHSFPSWSEFLPMVEFAINNSGGGTRSSKNRFGSCSSRVDANVVTYDADVDQVDIDEEDHLNNSDDAIIDSDDDDDAGIFSIVNDYASEEEDNLAEEENNLLAVRTKRTERQNKESAENFLLTREAVVRFVQDSIANAVDRQKRNADKNGRANVLSFKVNDLVLLSTVNLPGHAVTSVGSSKLLPKYIGPFRVLHRKGNAYTTRIAT
ncbi:unnamed protein product [Peronospora destructor]|uniref:Integrase catalytic domain-containing protein n=1 Tax=Peronospora destructor TaxID=86335 RepID=A0AAV0V888_9STRA|nr:unnamed protein product [Peronospora destructor]